jgi:drug/metabolite transporter (DMT)-like permease
MIFQHQGELAACVTAVAWTVTSLAFADASRRIGSISVNVLRLALAFAVLSIFGFFSRGLFIPVDAGIHQWIWLSISGFIGFVLGDLFLFRAFNLIGARVSMLIMGLAPFIAAFTAWIILGETMSARGFAGMIVTLSGVSLVVIDRRENGKSFSFSYPVKGILCAFGGALGQGVGIVLSKYGMKDFDPFASNQIRLIAGTIGFMIVVTALNRWKAVISSTENRSAMRSLTVGTIFGPVIGVSFSLIAVRDASAGIATTIMSIVPVLLIFPSWLIFKEHITAKEVLGAFVSFAGIALFFL